MSTHTHAPLSGSQSAEPSGGTPGRNCRRANCHVRGAHVHVRCRCGAAGVICPQQMRTRWYSATPEGQRVARTRDRDTIGENWFIDAVDYD